MSSNPVGNAISRLFSRWTLVVLAVAAVAWGVQHRVDQLGATRLSSTQISTETSMTLH